MQSQSRDLGLLRRQLEQSRVTTTKLRNIIEDLTRSDQTIDQRRYLQLARRTIRKLEGRLSVLLFPKLEKRIIEEFYSGVQSNVRHSLILYSRISIG